MVSTLKKRLSIMLLLLIGCISFVGNFSNASWRSSFREGSTVPQYDSDVADKLTKSKYVVSIDKVEKDSKLRDNIKALFYPGKENQNFIYKVMRGITLGVMIIFIVMAGASLLLNKKPEESKKHLMSLLYILLGGVFIYASSWLFGDVLNFGREGDNFTLEKTGIGGFTNVMIGNNSVLFVILSAIKAFAFFLAVIMIVVTGFKVIAAGEGEKGKKLIKGLINVVVALLIIKGVDFIYYLAADSSTFIKNASDFIINVAKIFGWIYGVIIVIMVIAAGYLYITDGGSGSNFKKASNVLVNILLSALVLFSFLLITYQIFAEFQEGGDALEEAAEETQTPPEGETAYNIVDKNYV